MIEQVRSGDEQGRVTIADALVGDGSREVRLPAAVAAGENQPAVGLFGELLRGLRCCAQEFLVLRGDFAHAQVKRLEGLARVYGQRREIGLVRFGAAEIGRIDDKFAYEVHIHQPAAHARLDTLKFHIAGNDGGQRGVVAMVDDLVQFFLRPLSGVLGAQVVQDEKGCVASLLEKIVVSHR